MTGIIVHLDQLRGINDRKERELEFYHEELERLMMKMGQLQDEVNLNKTIIRMIEQELIQDLTKF